MASQASIRRLSPDRVAGLCAQREALKLELAEIDSHLKEQVDSFGFTPAGAEKSKRLETDGFQITVSYGDTTEVRDQGVEAIKRTCPMELFEKLFSEQVKYKLKSGASLLLAGTLPVGAPSNLRKLSAAAVVTKPKTPSLRIEKVGAAD